MPLEHILATSRQSSGDPSCRVRLCVTAAEDQQAPVPSLGVTSGATEGGLRVTSDMEHLGPPSDRGQQVGHNVQRRNSELAALLSPARTVMVAKVFHQCTSCTLFCSMETITLNMYHITYLSHTCVCVCVQSPEKMTFKQPKKRPVAMDTIENPDLKKKKVDEKKVYLHSNHHPVLE